MSFFFMGGLKGRTGSIWFSAPKILPMVLNGPFIPALL